MTIGRWPTQKPAPDTQAWVDAAMQEQYRRRADSGESWWIAADRDSFRERAKAEETRLRNSRFGLHVNAVINT